MLLGWAHFKDEVPFCKKNAAKEVGGRLLWAYFRETTVICSHIEICHLRLRVCSECVCVYAHVHMHTTDCEVLITVWKSLEISMSGVIRA